MGRLRLWFLLPILAGCSTGWSGGVPPRPALPAPLAAASTPDAAAPGSAAAASAGSGGAATPAGAAGDPTQDPPAEAGAETGDDEIDDDVDGPAREPSQAEPPPPVVPAMSDEELLRRLQRDPASLGPLSVGRANSGLLVNGVQVGTGSRYVVLDPTHAWATRETVDYLDHAYDRARKELPALPKLHVGHLSAKQGGRLSPHKSHQAGRDVDVGYFYTQGKQDWYRRATAENLDVARTWAFVRALLSETDVEYIFINGSVQKPLKDHALKIGEDPAWLDQVFQLGSRQGDAIIRHAKGHDTHIHVRFYNPVAQELGRRAYPVLVKRGQIKPRQSYLQHRAVKGDTLGYLARRYGTTVRAIQQANGLRSIGLQAKHVYLIPKEGKAAPVEAPPGPTRVPARRLPPSPLPTAGSRSRG